MSKKKTSKTKGIVKKEIKVLKTSVTKLLDEARVKYKVLEHKTVYTAHDVGATTKKKLSEIAKVVLVRADHSWALIVVPAGKYIDLKGIKKVLKAKKVHIASEKDITKYLKTKVGLLHPFGSEYNIQTLMDKGMSRAKKMIASAGTYTDSVEIAIKDFEKLVKPIKGVFSKGRK